jgi:predicted nucleic acid-binding protein
MTFGDIPDGTAIFIDANTFVYAFSQHAQFGPACRDLLERIERAEIFGSTTTHVLSETAHRLMTLEACAVFGWPIAGIAQRLGRHPAQLQQLSAFREAIANVLSSQIQVIVSQSNLVLAAADISRQYGLLSNDALVVASMQANGLASIASHDTDFDCVPGLTRYAPA